METTSNRRSGQNVDLSALFSDLIRLETELWHIVDVRLRADHELPLPWFESMLVANRISSCRVVDIADALSITVGGTSKLVDRIEKAGWCVRTPNPDDGRSSVVSLTTAGRQLLRSAENSFDDELASRLGDAVSPHRLSSLADTIGQLRDHITDHQGVARP